MGGPGLIRRRVFTKGSRLSLKERLQTATGSSVSLLISESSFHKSAAWGQLYPSLPVPACSLSSLPGACPVDVDHPPQGCRPQPMLNLASQPSLSVCLPVPNHLDNYIHRNLHPSAQRSHMYIFISPPASAPLVQPGCRCLCSPTRQMLAGVWGSANIVSPHH